MTTGYAEHLQGRFLGILQWVQLDALWAVVRTNPEGWYWVELGHPLPTQPLSALELSDRLNDLDTLLRTEHAERYCGIVYADDVEAPQMIKVIDPRGMGSMCHTGSEPTPPQWVLSRLRPDVASTPSPISTKNRSRSMTVNRAISIMAGTMILLSLGLAHLNGQVNLGAMSWLWLTGFVGLNLFQMGFTGFCPAGFVFKALGLKEESNACGASSSGRCC
jgi:hypothetical protein